MDTNNNDNQENLNSQNTPKNNSVSVAAEALNAAKNVANATGSVVKGIAKTVNAVNNDNKENSNSQNTPKNNSVSAAAEALNAAKNVAKATGSVAKGTAKTVTGFAKVVTFIFSNLPLVGGIIAILFVVSLFAFNPFGWNLSLFGGPEIEKTENVVHQVKKISEFTTACYYEESVLKGEKVAEGKEWFGFKTDAVVETIVLTVKCKVRAGFDLSELGENDLVVVGDSVSIKLPVPKVFDVISNPSDYKIFEESGDWEHEEIVAMQVEGKKKTLNNAHNQNILQKANTIGKERIVALFTAMGFRVVNVTLSDVPVREQAPAEPLTTVQGENGSAVELVPAVEFVPATAETDTTIGAQPVVEAVNIVEEQIVEAAAQTVSE